MSLKVQLNSDLKAAMKAGDDTRKNVVRTIRGAVKNIEIEKQHELSDAEVLDVIAKQAKQRRESIEQFRQGNRLDLVEQEEAELTILEAYLPAQLPDSEIEARAAAVIAELGVSDLKGIGPVMGRLSQELKGVADGKRISAIVRELLSA